MTGLVLASSVAVLPQPPDAPASWWKLYQASRRVCEVKSFLAIRKPVKTKSCLLAKKENYEEHIVSRLARVEDRKIRHRAYAASFSRWNWVSDEFLPKN